MDSELEIRTADTEDVNIICYLAQQIWPVTYSEILSPGQLEYMLKLIYSPAALKEQMNIHHQFLIAELNEDPVGLASYSVVAEGVYKLHKLYVLPGLHGKGLGKAILEFVSEEAVSKGARTLRLNMNRQNKARKFY